MMNVKMDFEVEYDIEDYLLKKGLSKDEIIELMMISKENSMTIESLVREILR